MQASNKSASLASSNNATSMNNKSDNNNNNSNNPNHIPMPTTNIAVLQQMHYNANIPIASQNGTGLLNQGAGGIIPPILLEESRVPRFYKDAIARCGAPHSSQLPHTALVYNLMVTSRLPRPILGNIWSLVNRTLPGQLTRQEFFSCLALIALAQRGQTLSALSNVSVLPIPNFQACAPFTSTQQAQAFHPTTQAQPQVSRQANEAQQQTHATLINASVLAASVLPPPSSTRTLPVQIGVPILQKNVLQSSNMIPSMCNNTKQSTNKISAKNCNPLSNVPASNASLTPNIVSNQASTSNVTTNSLNASTHNQHSTQMISQVKPMTIPQQSSFISSINPPHLNNLNLVSTNNAIPKTSESATVTSTSSVQSMNYGHPNDPNSYQSLSSNNILSSVIINQKMPHSLTTPAISLSQQQQLHQHQHITPSPSSSLSSTNRQQSDFALFPSNNNSTNNQLPQQKLPYSTQSTMPTTQPNSLSFTNFNNNGSCAVPNPSAISSTKFQSSSQSFTGYANVPLPMSDSASSQVLLSNKQHLTNPSSINSSSSPKNSNIPIAQSQSQVSGRPNQNNLDLLCDISFGQQQPSEAQMDRGASNSVQSMSLSAGEDLADRSNEQFGDFTSSSPVPSTVPSDALLNPQPIVPISLNSEVFSNEKQEAKDIYAVMKAVEGDMQGSEQEQENVHVWKRCIQEAYCLFSDADQLLPIASEIFINDIAQTERGAKYLSALRAIYEMVSRIRKGRVEELREVKNELEQIDRIWQRIKRYTPDQSTTINESDQSPLNSVCKQCGICVMQINETDLLEFAGTSYHKQCANLWINRIDSLLPKLS